MKFNEVIIETFTFSSKVFLIWSIYALVFYFVDAIAIINTFPRIMTILPGPLEAFILSILIVSYKNLRILKL